MQPGMRARPCESGKALPGAAGKGVTEAIVDLPLYGNCDVVRSNFKHILLLFLVIAQK